MRIAVIGAGPAGLYFAALRKLRHPRDDIRIFEQNPADATFGFGVVFSDTALEFLHADDPDTVRLIAPHLETWRDITVIHRGQAVVIDGIGFSAIGRLDLLHLLVTRAQAVGIEPVYGRAVRLPDEVRDADLIVGADGLNSLVRRSCEADFATSLSYLDNTFAWYGTAKRFDTLTQTFVESRFGPFNAHHYRYSGAMSTFIVECSPETWANAGFAGMSEEQSLRLCEDIFAETLDGYPLIANRSVWRTFPKLWAGRWVCRNMALLGDAAHTAHFSIGSGTRLALEDAVALAAALEAHPDDLAAALDAYDATRRPIARKIVEASMRSAAWYEHFGAHMSLAPFDFAMSYIARSGRLDRERLVALSPGFMLAYDKRGSVKGL
ncbi:MAG: FAD-dependent monooxygenase [Hyphomicrobiaceae bacterium]